jgi:ribonuclease P protein component
MLPAAHRMRSSTEFREVLRRGRSVARRDVILHVGTGQHGPARVGIVVGRAVGGSVVRHRVARRLRAQLAGRLSRLPDGTCLVARARSSAAGTDSAELGGQLDSALSTLGMP